MWLASVYASQGSIGFGRGCWQFVLAAPLTSLLAFKAPAILGQDHSRNTTKTKVPIIVPLPVASADVSFACLAGAACCSMHMCMHGYARVFSSSRTAGDASDNGSPTLQKQLRQLMKKVHPDRWASSDHPEARTENERSFKLLQEYMDAGKVKFTNTGVDRCAYQCDDHSCDFRMPAFVSNPLQAHAWNASACMPWNRYGESRVNACVLWFA